MKVTLKAKTNASVSELASHAARLCYSMNPDILNQPIDIRTRLFEPGHHTTLQHNFFTFLIEDIPVSAVVFGLHLASPYYNSDQRSGRYSKMYNTPDFQALRDSFHLYYPEIASEKVMSWVEKGVRIYQDNIGRLTELAAQKISEERPFAGEKYIAQNAPKFAQEQLRNFLSQLAPTALDFTVNLSALTALYRVAWTNEMRRITEQMAALVVGENPDIGYMFDAGLRKTEWAPEVLSYQAKIITRPRAEVLNVIGNENVVNMAPLPDSMDILPFSPQTMNNSSVLVQSEVVCSCAAFGQDQRHRSVKRTAPVLTGDFYVPPLVAEAGLAEAGLAHMQEWLNLAQEIGPNAAALIAPYGAVVKYQKTADVNALMHEQAKRTCWCAQEEIYALSCDLRNALKSHFKNEELLRHFAPPCMTKGVCQEGGRYCGRNLKETCFLTRKI